NLLTDIAGSAERHAVHPCCSMPVTVNPAIQTIFSNINSGLASASLKTDSDTNLTDVFWGYQAPLKHYFPTVRVDYNMRENLRMFLSWNMTQSSQGNGNVPPLPGSYYSKFGGTNTFKYYTVALGLSSTIKPAWWTPFPA